MVKNTIAEEKTLVLSRSKHRKIFLLMFIITLFSVNMVSAFNFTDGSLVAYYPLNETTGTVRDVSMTGHDGLVSNAFDFDGVKDYINTSSKISISGDFSWNTWIKTTNNTNYAGILSTYDNGGNDYIQLVLASTGVARISTYSSSAVDGSTTINDGNWHQITITRTSGSYALYVDGNDESISLSSSNNPNEHILIGNERQGNIMFDGLIDEVGIWSRALSGAEITSLNNSGVGKSYSQLTAGEKTNLVSYYSLDEVGSDPLDSHGSNNGTLSGGTNNGATRGATGIIENAFDFDGTNDFIEISDNSNIRLLTGGTINTWMTYAGDRGFIVGKSDGAQGTGGYVIEVAGTEGNANIDIALGAGWDLQLTGVDLYDSWQMVTVTWDGSDIYAYLNGSEIGHAVSSALPDDDTNNLFIGKRYANDQYIGADFDEFGIWDRALNSTEISGLYNSGAGLAYGGGVTTPTVTLVSPTNGTTISDIGTNFTVSGNEKSGFTWANLTYYVWNENGSLHNQTTVDLGDVTNFTNILFIDDFVLGEYTWNAQGCYNGTSDGCSEGENRTLIVGASVQNQTFSNSTYETSTEDFNASITLLPGVVIQAAYLYYDDMKYLGTVTSTGSDNYDLGISLDIPLTPVAENKTWFWNFVYTSPTQREQNGTAMLQEVNPINFAECNATLTTLVLNMTIKEEGTFGLIDSNLEFNADYWLGDGDIYKNLAFSNTDENVSNFQFCTSNTEDFIIDDIISYWSTDYERREYFLSRATLNNNTMNLNLYLLNTSTTDTFTVKVQDENDADVEGAFVYVQRWDIGTGNFHTVGMVKTSSDGSGIINLRLTDAWYRFQVNYNGILYLTTEPKKEAGTSRTLKIDLTEDNPYALFGNVSYSLTFDETTNLSVFTYSDPSGAVQVGCLKVLKVEGTGNTQEYYSCVESTAGTLSYQIPDDGTYIIRAIFRLGSENDNLETVIDEIIRKGTGERFIVTGTFGQFISLMITGTMAAVGIAAGSIPLGLALIFISLVVVNLLGWLNISSSVLYGLLTVLILVGFSLRRGR